MDFMNRSNQPQPTHQSSPSATPTSTTHVSSAPISKQPKPTNSHTPSKLIRAGLVSLLFATTVVAVAVIGILIVGNTNDQSKFVAQDKYQAVFLTNGQVYFGKLKEVNKDYFNLTDVYYLTQNATTDSSSTAASDSNYTLVKLGCQQIHSPYDSIVFERSQISFWQNIRDDGKVVTSIGEYQTQNKGKTTAELCATTSTQTQASDTSTPQGANAGTGTTTKTP